MIFYEEHNDFTDQVSRYMGADLHTYEWWLEAARRALCWFTDKWGFLNWVHARYGDPIYHFVASVCWDIMSLQGTSS